MRRGEIWFAPTPGGARPVLVLTRDPIADRIGAVVVAALTRTRRGLVSELELTAAEDGLPSDCVANFDNIHTLAARRLPSADHDVELRAPPTSVPHTACGHGLLTSVSYQVEKRLPRQLARFHAVLGRSPATLTPMQLLSRRGFFGVAGAAGLVTIAACSSKEQTDSTPSAATVKHRFGETSIPAPPKRVVSAGFTEQDDLLAVGVVPIAVTNWWGDQPFAVWPWAQPKLGPAQPTVLSLDNGLEFDKIAALKPDLIVATNAGVDQDSYNRLSAIAPTIPQTGDQPFFEPWKEQATAIGQAVFQADQMASLIEAVDNKFTEVANANPQFKDKKALILQGSFYLDNVVATLPGWRTEFLTQMGFVIPDDIKQFGVDQDRALIPRDKAVAALGAADALIWTTESDDQQARLLADPTFAQLKSTIGKRNVFTGKDLAGAIAFSSPLSLPVVADQLPPMLAKVIR